MVRGILLFMNNFDKPFKSIDEQIEILQQRNIIITDIDFARSVLNSLSYYTIVNGYKNSFLSITGTDLFAPGTRFEELYTLHILDTRLNSIIFKNILYVERYLKTRLSYIISQNYGVYTDFNDLSNSNTNDYLYRGYYSRSTGQKDNILRSIKKSILSPRKNFMMEHYLTTKNHIPPWIVTTNIPLGLAIQWYTILKQDDKTSISNQFLQPDKISIDAKKEFLKKAFSLLKEYRNNIAHGNRTFNTLARSVLPKNQLLILAPEMISEFEYNSGIGQKDLFAVVLSIFILIDDTYLLSNFFNDLKYVLSPYNQITIANKSIYNTFNLPDDIFERIERYLTKS